MSRYDPLPAWRVYWAPEGRCIATVAARDAKAAIRKAPYPYRKYLGELYAEQVNPPTDARSHHE